MAQNTRYNIELFEPAAPRGTSAAPKIKQNNQKPDLKVLEKPRKTQAQIKAQNAASNKKVFKIIVVASICLCFLAAVIYSTLQLDEINRDIASIDKQMRVAKSETVRLNMEINSIISMDKVEDYAANTLGMSKVQNYQVVYVDLSSSDRVLMASGKETEQTNVINQENN